MTLKVLTKKKIRFPWNTRIEDQKTKQKNQESIVPETFIFLPGHLLQMSIIQRSED